MPISVSFNDQSFTLPLQGDNYTWGNGVTSFLSAVAAAAFSPASSNFPLTQTVNFGTDFGIEVLSVADSAHLPTATIGLIRGANNNAFSGFAWRNAADSDNLYLYANASDELVFNGTTIGSGTVSSVDITPGSSKVTATGGPITSSGSITVDIVPANILLPTLGGNLGVSQLNSGTGASAATWWRGDGTWATPPGAVSSVFGRTGAVIANLGDYSFPLVSGVAAITQGGTGQGTASLGLNALFAGTTTLALPNLIQFGGDLGTYTNSPYWQSTTGTDTRLRARANHATLGAAAHQTYGSSSFTDTKYVSFRSTGQFGGATPPDITWGALVAGVEQNTAEPFAFRTRVGGSFVNSLTVTPAGPNLGFTPGADSDAVRVDTLRGSTWNTIALLVPGGSSALTNAATQILTMASTTAAYTLVFLPTADLKDGQIVRITCTGGDVTALTLTPGAGQVIHDAPAGLVAGSGIAFIFVAASLDWYRLY